MPTTDVDDGLQLTSVNYLNDSIACLVLSYSWNGILLVLENYDLNLWYDQHKLEKNFHPLPSFINSHPIHIAVSDDQQLISIRTGYVSR